MLVRRARRVNDGRVVAKTPGTMVDAKGEVGIRDKKLVPTLRSFCVERVEPWAKATFEQAAPKTWLWYGFGIKSLKESLTLGNLKLEEIGPGLIAEFGNEGRAHQPR